MTSRNEFAHIETQLRQRLAMLADHAPTTVHALDEVPVVASFHAERPRRRRLGVIAAVTALIGAGGFTTYSFLGASNSGGAASPEEAVTAFVSAAEHQDILGLIDVTAPEEVAVLRTSIDMAIADGKRTQVLAESFDAKGVQGVDIGIDGLKLSTNLIDSDLAAVTVTAGTLHASFDPATFPMGDSVRQLLNGDAKAGSAAATLGATDPPVMLATVQRNGRWYVSLEYTAAEYLRFANHWDAPPQVNRTPVGADTPEAAVSAFYERLAAFDLQGAMDTFAPHEDAMAWLAPMWLPAAQQGSDTAHAKGWLAKVSGLQYETIGSGDHVVLKPTAFTIDATVAADYGVVYDQANPEWSTVVTSADGSEFALVGPGQVPATIDGLTFSPEYPQFGSAVNFTSAYPDGTIAPLVFPTPNPDGPKSLTVVRADGCTTYTGAGAESMFAGFGPRFTGDRVDGGFRLCGTASVTAPLFFIYGGFTELPSVAVVQSAGKWFVSPLGTALATVTASLHDVKDGAGLFDSPVGVYVYGINRSMLELATIGKSADSVDPACLPALTVVNGAVTGVVAAPPVDAIRACSSEDLSSGPVVGQSKVIAVAPLPAATTVATTP
jgi:hypothetical protein